MYLLVPSSDFDMVFHSRSFSDETNTCDKWSLIIVTAPLSRHRIDYEREVAGSTIYTACVLPQNMQECGGRGIN